jgi:hypothetical protein
MHKIGKRKTENGWTKKNVLGGVNIRKEEQVGIYDGCWNEIHRKNNSSVTEFGNSNSLDYEPNQSK